AARAAGRPAYGAGLHAGLDLAPGLAGWLDQAAVAGMALAVASSSPVWWVRDHLTRVGRADDFRFLCGGNEVAAHKPAPDVYLLALARLGLPAGQAVAVEDTPPGAAAAQAAGLR